MDTSTYKEHFSKNFLLAYPVVLSQLGHILVSVFDSLMVGQIGTLPLAAASLGNSIFTITLVFGLGVSYSITPLIAAADGRRNYTRISLLLLNGLVSNTLLGVILFIAGYFLSPFITLLDQPPAVVVLAVPYINILFLSMVPLMVFQAFRQFAEGLSLTKQAMYISIVANSLNILLNYIFIFGKLGLEPMGLVGAGWATLISRVVMALMMGGYVLYAKRFLVFRRFMHLRHLSFHHMYRIFKLGLPISGQMIFEMGAFSFSAVMIGWLGVKELAAHQIAINVASVTYMMASGIAAAATIRVGNQKGLGNYRAMRMAGFSNLVLGIIFMTCSGLLIVLGNELIPMLYIDDPEVIQIASTLLVIAALFQISDGVQVVGLGALRGLEDVRVPSLISLLAYWVVGLPVGYLLCFKADFGVNGIWLGLLVGLSVAAALLTLRFRMLSNRLTLS
ncbi:MATE family multidrug resistance protein [Pontibacter ummariensis]|uniref:Multidrug-efflux transporter n=1 Tax=Pontibacter ummariensis TaxID=1610492 RepID=A0A239L7V4_9BACT|nr:MATE family efflux transporter [Pontibacter ummariensis]PRY04276.1 MATE family multidrug resistance protein [Pontibacter ummariensis]SNT25614.1 multidrug resistance protein, MATE family [Pontibacter ummariensis]